MNHFKLRFIFVFSFSFLFCFIPLSCGKLGDTLEIHMIDVGEGDSILIQTPKGENILIDVGNPITGYRVAEYLKEKGIKKIDHLIFSHPDQDHIGGTFFVMQMFDVKKIYDNGENLTGFFRNSDFYYWYHDLVRKHAGYRKIYAGDEIEIKGIDLKVVWPPSPLPFKAFNPNSVVLMLQYGEFKALFTGDLIESSEKKLLATGIDLKADLLKAGHHGSYDSTSDPFVDAVSPKVVLISANHGKRRNYPATSVLKKLVEREIPTYWTEKHGAILLSAKPDGSFKVKPSK